MLVSFKKKYELTCSLYILINSNFMFIPVEKIYMYNLFYLHHVIYFLEKIIKNFFFISPFLN
jgi:hypothetical protein